jgi:hypothetical protein
MRITTRSLLFGALVCTLPTLAAAQLRQETLVRNCGDLVCDQVVVRLRPGESVAGLNATWNTRTVRSIPSRRLFLLRIPPTGSAQTYRAWLAGDSRVAWAELNHMVIAPAGGTQSFFLFGTAGEYETQASMELIGADDAQKWAGGADQIVAVLDTGVDPDHPVMAGRLAPGGFNYIDNNDDFRDIGDGDLVGHGTMVSGLILRVAPEAAILPLKVLNADGVGTSFYVAQAMYDSIDRGATIINASLGTIRPSQLVADAAQAALDSGVLVIASAGNYDREEPRYYPAAFSSVMSVAGTDSKDVKAPFSDFGDWIDIAAPAVELVGPFPRDAYAISSGNSLAAALVSGSAALVRAQQPHLTPLQVGARLKNASTNIDAYNPEHIGLLGAGRLDALEAVIAPDEAAPRPR